MASRLSRWTTITGVTLLAMMAALLPPGDAPSEVGRGAPPDQPTNALDGAILANHEALNAARFALTNLRRQRILDRYRASRTSPLVLRSLPDSFEVDTARTRAAGTLWSTLPAGSDVPRTLLILSGDLERIAPMTPARCESRLPTWTRSISQGSPLYEGAGACFLQARFGFPGTGIRTWLDSIGSVAVPRARSYDRAVIEEMIPSHDVLTFVFRGPSDQFAWWAGPEVEACAGGRADFCLPALEFVPHARGVLRYWNNGWMHERLFADLPSALYRDLGAERFGALWRSDRPVPEAYEAITGRPFDEWVQDFVQRRVGRVAGNTKLTLGGWLGWLLWMGLLGGLMGTRLRAQGITA